MSLEIKKNEDFCTHSSNIVSTQETHQRQNMSRWELVNDVLNEDFTSFYDLQARLRVDVVTGQNHVVAALAQNSKS